MPPVSEKLQLLEDLLKAMPCIGRCQFTYHGIDICAESKIAGASYEYTFKNSAGVVLQFVFYPEFKEEPDYLLCYIESPKFEEEANLVSILKEFDINLNLSNLDQFQGDFGAKATALVGLINQTLGRPELSNILVGISGVSVPAFSMRD
ncbi:hypothetical protein [Microbulbifer sp. JMSA003]|uniref:hypothetical protein n=1 Tax=Microbulbifer sp. JMSA003 TaxID=3243369 RepID=UPI004039782E